MSGISLQTPSIRRFLVLCTLSTTGFTYPLLDLYGRTPEAFVATRMSPPAIVGFALVVAFLLPLIGLGGLLVLDRVKPAWSEPGFRLQVVLGALATGLAVSRQLTPDHGVAAVLITGTVVFLVHRFFTDIEPVFRWFSPLPVLTVAIFLWLTPASRLIWEEASAVETQGVGTGAPIVFIQLDELPTASLMTPAGQINRDLFPNFARLAETGTWYRNALSTSIATTQSVPSIMTGRLVDGSLSPTAVDHPRNLFTLLADSYQMHVIEGPTDLCVECEDFAGRGGARFGAFLVDATVVYGHVVLPDFLRDRIPSIDNTWSGFLGQGDAPTREVDIPMFDVPPAGVRSEWVGWMQLIADGIEKNQPPTLHYAHLYAPHAPWRINPSGTHYQRPEQGSEVDGVAGSGFWEADDELPRLGFQRHLFQLGFVDRMLGVIFDRLDRTGQWDEALVVVVADHGASFTPGEHRRWPYADNRDDLYRVPMFVKLPGQFQGETVDIPAYTIDLLPTIVDALEIETDWVFDGVSLLEPPTEPRPHRIIHWCCSREPADTDLDALFDQVARNHRWIPDQSSWTGVVAVGPLGSNVGRDVAELDPHPDPDLKWALEQTDDLITGNRRPGMAQTLIFGRVELPAGVDVDDLLIAVNGRVAGTGFIRRDGTGGGGIRGLIAEEFLASGPNRIALLIPVGDGWLTGSAADLTLEYVTADGRTLQPSVEGSRRLQLDPAKLEDETYLITGWAVDTKNKVVADRIHVFVGETLIVSGEPDMEVPAVVGWFHADDLLRSGFSFQIPSAAIPAGTDQITVIAEFGDRSIADTLALGS